MISLQQRTWGVMATGYLLGSWHLSSQFLSPKQAILLFLLLWLGRSGISTPVQVIQIRLVIEHPLALVAATEATSRNMIVNLFPFNLSPTLLTADPSFPTQLHLMEQGMLVVLFSAQFALVVTLFPMFLDHLGRSKMKGTYRAFVDFRLAMMGNCRLKMLVACQAHFLGFFYSRQIFRLRWFQSRKSLRDGLPQINQFPF